MSGYEITHGNEPEGQDNWSQKAQMLDFNYIFWNEPCPGIVINDRQSITNTPTNENVCRSRSTIGGTDKADNPEDDNR